MGDNGKNGNGRRVYRTYRDMAGGDLEALIGPALADYHDHYGRLPLALAVHESAVGKAREVLDGLEVALEVTGCGGALVGECWLQVGENVLQRPHVAQSETVRKTAQNTGETPQATLRATHDPPSMLARVEAAQLAVTPERARQLVFAFEGEATT